VTRLLVLLRGHGLITKVAKTHRYQLTEKGRSTVTLLLAARTADTQKLLQAG
jgi:DNA-binding PadR family transcriptional regulator